MKRLMSPVSSIDRGWSIVTLVVAFTILFAFFFTAYSFGVLYNHLIVVYRKIDGNQTAASVNSSSLVERGLCSYDDGQNLSGITAWIGSISVAVHALLSPVSAYLCRRLGYRIVIMIGSLLFGLGTSLTAAVTTSPWQGVLLYGVLGGIGAAGVYAPTLSLIPLHFDKHLSLASGIAMSACFLGPAAGSPISQAVIDRFDSAGLAVLYGSLGLLCFGTAILIRPSSRHKKADISAAEAEPEATNGVLAMFASARKHPRIIVWVLVMACEYILLYITMVHMIRHAECALKSDTTTSSLLLTYLYVSTAVGSVITGSVGRRVKCPVYFQMSLMIINGALAAFFPLYNSYALLAVFSVLFGLSVSLVSLMPFVISFIMGARLAPHGVFLMTFVTGSFATIGPPLAGWMYDLFGNYQYSFVVTGLVVLLTATVEIGIEAVLQRKRNHKEKETMDETIDKTALHDLIIST